MTAIHHLPEPEGPSSLRPPYLLVLDHPGDRTTLKWGSNGELSELDQARILRRLCAADPMACQLLDGDDARD